MSERSLLEDVVTNLFAERCTPERVVASESNGWDGELWAAAEELGLPLASVPEEHGGSGVSLQDACTLLRVAGRHAVPLPLAETGFMAGWLLSRAGLPVPPGPLTVAPATPGESLTVRHGTDGGTLSGHATAVPWASAATTIAVVASTDDGRRVVAAMPRTAVRIESGSNLAGEPLDTVVFRDAPLDGVPFAPLPVDEDGVQKRGALGYATLMLGALEHVRDLSIAYASQREQFGRPIARFQAIQQRLAQMAREVAIARAAVELAIRAAAQAVDPPWLEIAVAKVTAGNAAQSVSAHAHQIHAAIGITKEYPLHLFTRRLWSWRDVFGSELAWARRIGGAALDPGQDLWELMTGTRTEAEDEERPAP